MDLSMLLVEERLWKGEGDLSPMYVYIKGIISGQGQKVIGTGNHSPLCTDAIMLGSGTAPSLIFGVPNS